MPDLYYTPPRDELFIEVKQKCIELWETFDNQYGYATDKINRIKDIRNVEDNFMYMVAMFDLGNQTKLSKSLSEQAREAIRERMLDGGRPLMLIPF